MRRRQERKQLIWCVAYALLGFTIGMATVKAENAVCQEDYQQFVQGEVLRNQH
ncbi:MULTISPECIES: hypothetical protein [unclassified Agarivorans]|uniref:hypothetical protein n=1 Tax=unclassified Agarivorans TaxID=2636026 RepID=UPI0026E2B827|nr:MULTISPECIES: hypothetical protein [unclassified Agarivorans]MDO6685050.1 hypothetical protein [Agarivorans sp. 3_MG-2023]MDO6717392.1 hypothetical protein [Agarivorans sp. 2_MG-2023]